MGVIEFKGCSLSEAIDMAAEQFNVAKDSIKYKIIPEKSKYFGHKHKEIFIHAWIEDQDKEYNKLVKFLKEIIILMNLDLTIKYFSNEKSIQINFTGNDFKLLFYKNGELLNSFQYLLNRLFSSLYDKKIYCECNNFRKNKEKELSKLAHKHARSIQHNGNSITLRNLTPFERRIIHMTINKYQGIESISIGNRFLKTLTIKKSLDGS